MGVYSIAQLENLSGVKSHTIRIWEQRYNLLTPARTDTNIRYYTDEQLRKLMNVSALLRGGMKISQVSKLTEEQIHEKLEQLIDHTKSNDPFFEIYIQKFIASAVSFDEASFEKDFSSAIVRYGVDGVYVNIILPFLERLGLMWGTKKITPVQEHFISHLIRQKIISAIDGLPFSEASTKKIILFLPEDEEHEIGLLFANYLLRLNGVKVIYLGARVPLNDLLDSIKEIDPDYLMTFLTRIRPMDEMNNYIDQIDANFSGGKLVIAGNSWLLSQIKNQNAIIRMNGIEVFKDFCKSLK